MKAVVAVVVAAIPITLIYLLGVLTGAEGSGGAWLLSALIVLAGAAVFALYGLAFGLALRSEAAVGAASGSLVILAFMGNIFFPLSGTLLTLAKFTPLYGYASLARYPLTEGYLFNTSDGTVTHEALWVPVVNVSVWAVILALLATWLVRRGRARQ
jgi:ABC-2 type transport system permease protein